MNSLLDKPGLIEMNYRSLNGLNITLVHLKIHVLFPRYNSRDSSSQRDLLSGSRPLILTPLICPAETGNCLQSQSVLVKIVNI